MSNDILNEDDDLPVSMEIMPNGFISLTQEDEDDGHDIVIMSKQQARDFVRFMMPYLTANGGVQ